jgi:hypothetical protein
MSNRTAAAAAPATAPVDPLAVFEARCWARAKLYELGELELLDAVDELQAAAEAGGLVERIGQDAVQKIIAAAFYGARP